MIALTIAAAIITAGIIYGLAVSTVRTIAKLRDHAGDDVRKGRGAFHARSSIPIGGQDHA